MKSYPFLSGEETTPHQKASTKVAPLKADHKHEYIRPFYMSKIRRFDGSVSEKEYKLSIAPFCIECGFVNRRTKVYLEVEVDRVEGRKLWDLYYARENN